MKGRKNKMKKTITLLLTLALCFSLCACGDSKGVWCIKETVDEFGDTTEDSAKIITGTFNGTFNSSSNSEGSLSATIYIEKKTMFNHYRVGFDLKENDNTNTIYYSAADLKTFKMKINDEIIPINLTGSSPNDTLYLENNTNGWTGDILFNELLKGNDIRCIINIGNSEYNFTIKSGNFSSICKRNNFSEGIIEYKLEENLIGGWGYQVNSIDGPCYQFYVFSADYTYQSVWDNENAPSKSSEVKGTYEIKDSEIILTDNSGATDTIIKYSYINGALQLIDTHSDGSGNRLLIKLEN